MKGAVSIMGLMRPNPHGPRPHYFSDSGYGTILVAHVGHGRDERSLAGNL